MLLTPPNRSPSCQMRASRQSGHQRRPPGFRRLRGGRARPQQRHQERGREHRQAPQRDGDAPIAAGERQHQRQRQADGENLADQQPVGVDRGGKSDAVGQPAAHDRRQRRLHDRDAGPHRDGGGKQHGHVGGGPARRRRERIDDEARDQRRPRPEARDDERARHGGRREQQRRQAGQRADRGLGEIEVAMDERQQGRHRQHGHAQRRAAQPDEAERGQEPARRRSIHVSIFMLQSDNESRP